LKPSDVVVSCQFPRGCRWLLSVAETQAADQWPKLCLTKRMNTLTFKVSRKSGEYVKPGLLPQNHSAQAHFGVMDGVVVGFFALCVTGLILLLLQF
jgi:hypothetical protein